jgi:hypothetical protein
MGFLGATMLFEHRKARLEQIAYRNIDITREALSRQGLAIVNKSDYATIIELLRDRHPETTPLLEKLSFDTDLPWNG